MIGGHPAFNVPGGKLEGMIKLDNEEPMDALKSLPTTVTTWWRCRWKLTEV